MRPKVSIVVPCYNKEKYIGNMFNSILAQKWDNIELILVNDGSTDGTRDVISEYEPVFRGSGFEVVIIDQDNRGLPGAVYSGLKRVSGEFVCTVDADDELHPGYLSTMAGWLAEHDDFDWTACDINVTRGGKSWVAGAFPPGAGQGLSVERRGGLSIESFIFCRMLPTAMKHVIRTSYLRKCKVIENYFAENIGSQESQLLIPLIYVSGKIKYFAEPLYNLIYLEAENHHSTKDFAGNFYEKEEYHRGWFVPVKETIKTLPVTEHEKERLYAVCELSLAKKLYISAAGDPEQVKTAEDLLGKYCSLLDAYFTPSPNIANVPLLEAYCLFEAVEDNIIGIKKEALAFEKASGRIIAWGVLGKRGSKTAEMLKGTDLEPDELWDIAGDGISVKKPDLGTLAPDDIVLVLPLWSKDILESLKEAPCRTVINPGSYLSALKFPQFYDGSVKFNPA